MQLYSQVACGTDWIKMQCLNTNLLGKKRRGTGAPEITWASSLTLDSGWGAWPQLNGWSPWLHSNGFPAFPALQICLSGVAYHLTSWSLLSLWFDCSCLGFSRETEFWQMDPHNKLLSLCCPCCSRWGEGKPRPQPSCPVHKDGRAQLTGTLLFQQNRTSQCCWLLCYIFPDRALAIKIDAIIHMDSCNCKWHSESKNGIHSLTQTYPQSIRMWHTGSMSVPNYECCYLLFLQMLFMIATFAVN